MTEITVIVPDNTLKKLREKGIDRKQINNLIARDLKAHADIDSEKLAKNMPRPGQEEEATA